MSPGRTVPDLGRPRRRRRRSPRPAITRHRQRGSGCCSRSSLLPFALVAAASPADARDLLRRLGRSRLHQRHDPHREVDVVEPASTSSVTGPGGFDETATSDDRGRWSVQVRRARRATPPAVDEETLPANVGVTGTEGSVPVTITQPLAGPEAVAFGVRTGDCRAAVSTSDRIIRSTFSGLRLGLLLALASIGLSLIYGTTGLSNFAHAELVIRRHPRRS